MTNSSRLNAPRAPALYRARWQAWACVWPHGTPGPCGGSRATGGAAVQSRAAKPTSWSSQSSKRCERYCYSGTCVSPCRGSSGRARDGNKHARTHLYHAAGPIFSVPFLKSVRWAVKVASAVKCSTRRHTNLLSVPCSICGSCDEESGWPFSPRLGFQELLPAALHGPPRRGPPTGSPPLTFTGRSCGTVSQGLVHADAFRAPALRTCPGRESTVTRGGTHAGHGGECAERRGALRGSGPGRG